jgi:anti-anti-sigma factor
VSVLRRGTSGGDGCWVAVEGPLDGPTSRSLRDLIRALLEHGCRRLVVDLRGTSAIEGSGLRVLVEALREIEELGGALVLRVPPGEVYELGRVRRLGELLATVDQAIDEAEAIRRLDRRVS